MKKLMPAVLLASGSGSNLQTIIDQIAAGRLDIDLRLVVCNNPGAFVLERARKAGIAVWSASHKDYSSREAFDLDIMKAVDNAGIKPNLKSALAPDLKPNRQAKPAANQEPDEKAGPVTELGPGRESKVTPGDDRGPIKISEAGCVILAGYMRLLSEAFIAAYAGRIVNIHPAILPSFAGARGGPDAISYGVKISGCTVHFVDEIMDHGPIIIQAAAPHKAGEDVDSLMRRIHALEHRILPQALQWLAEDRLLQKGRIVHLLPANDSGQVLASQGNEQGSPWLISPALEHF